VETLAEGLSDEALEEGVSEDLDWSSPDQRQHVVDGLRSTSMLLPVSLVGAPNWNGN